MAPLAKWCNAEYVEKRVSGIRAKDNIIEFEDGSTMEYDYLAVNVGSRTRGSHTVKGVWENSLTTRPINDLLGKIHRKEQEFVESKKIPQVVVCGAGAAGVELAFAFQKRWTDVFGDGTKVTLLSAENDVLKQDCVDVRDMTRDKLIEKGIQIEYNCKVKEVTPTEVLLEDGRVFSCNMTLWATGAEAQEVATKTDLDILKGYFRVNDYLQSTSHPNVFGGGDCIQMETYADQNFPPKAGVYAVRAGPFVA